MTEARGREKKKKRRQLSKHHAAAARPDDPSTSEFVFWPPVWGQWVVWGHPTSSFSFLLSFFCFPFCMVEFS
jgi:hypothetical protein